MPRYSHLISLAFVLTLASPNLSAPTVSNTRSRPLPPFVSKIIASTLALSGPSADQLLRSDLRRSARNREFFHQHALPNRTNPRTTPNRYTPSRSLLQALSQRQASHSIFSPRTKHSDSNPPSLNHIRRQFTFDSCADSSQCEPPRRCEDIDGEDIVLCDGGTTCFCSPEQLLECDDTDDCFLFTMEEVCVRGEFATFCISKQYFQQKPEGFTLIPPTGGFTLDSCIDDTICREDRNCVLSSDESESCAGEDDCVCIPPTPESCAEDGDCVIGEVCDGTCISASLANPDTVTTSPTTTTVSSETSTATPSGSGLSGDRCRTRADCRGERTCREIDLTTLSPDGPECSDGVTDCACIPENFNLCVQSADCLNSGETCAVVQGNTRLIVCLSEEAVAREEGLEPVSPADVEVSEVCVDAKALDHLPRDELVFEEHAVGHVLCDSEGSCATRGHIVVFSGRAMMMTTYCEIVGCKGRVMRVNSPKYLPRRRVKSRTEGLEYTAFAARWETKVEEQVLTTAVRLGL